MQEWGAERAAVQRKEGWLKAWSESRIILKRMYSSHTPFSFLFD